MRVNFLSLGVLAFVGACGYVDAYEEAVHDWEPTYCYKSIGGVECFREPYHRDERRLVNYFGPHPSRFDKPEPAEPAPHSAPKMINYWVKDPEPVPRPAPTGKVSELPWLDPALMREEADKREFARVEANPEGTHALLKRMGIGPHGEVELKKARRAGLEEKEARALSKIGVQNGTPNESSTGAQAEAPVPAAAPVPLAAPVPPVIEIDVN